MDTTALLNKYRVREVKRNPVPRSEPERDDTTATDGKKDGKESDKDDQSTKINAQDAHQMLLRGINEDASSSDDDDGFIFVQRAEYIKPSDSRDIGTVVSDLARRQMRTDDDCWKA